MINVDFFILILAVALNPTQVGFSATSFKSKWEVSIYEIIESEKQVNIISVVIPMHPNDRNKKVVFFITIRNSENRRLNILINNKLIK
jgi:hypothetical protein